MVAASSKTLNLSVCASPSVELITVWPAVVSSPVWLFGFLPLFLAVGFTLLSWFMLWVRINIARLQYKFAIYGIYNVDAAVSREAGWV